MAVATYTDVGTALGRPITDPTEQAQVAYWLDAAELVIGARLGDVTLLDQNVLKYVEVEAVSARMLNPGGYQSETIDDYTYRFGTETRQIAIRDEWWRLLDPETGSGAFSARPYFTADDPTGWPLDWS